MKLRLKPQSQLRYKEKMILPSILRIPKLVLMLQIPRLLNSEKQLLASQDRRLLKLKPRAILAARASIIHRVNRANLVFRHN